MLIKTKPKIKRRAAFLSYDATDKEIAEFVRFLNAGGSEEEKRSGTTGDSDKGRTKKKAPKKAAKRKPSRPKAR